MVCGFNVPVNTIFPPLFEKCETRILANHITRLYNKNVTDRTTTNSTYELNNSKSSR